MAGRAPLAILGRDSNNPSHEYHYGACEVRKATQDHKYQGDRASDAKHWGNELR
jgi:hypothetical protein